MCLGAPVEIRKNLIICPTGEGISFHKDWVRGTRNFDIMIINYSNVPGKGRGDTDYYFETKGFKFEIIKKAIEANVDIVKGYNFVWLPDDDLAIRTKDINKLFDIFNAYELEFGQASVRNNFCIHRSLRRRINCVLRYVNFAELMCPVFSVESLFKVLDTFDINKSGWGIDWVWAERLQGKRIAVIDEVSVFHKRALYSGPLYKKFHKQNISTLADLNFVTNNYIITERYEEYGRIFKPWAKKFGILGTSNIAEKLLMIGQDLFYLFQFK